MGQQARMKRSHLSRYTASHPKDRTLNFEYAGGNFMKLLAPIWRQKPYHASAIFFYHPSYD